MSAISVPYKCRCMAADAVVTVPARRPGEDIAHWMETCLQLAIHVDHRLRSPACMGTELEYAKVPFHESNPNVGGAPILS